MKIIVKYEILDYKNVAYGMYLENGEAIPSPYINDNSVPLGGISSDESWMKHDAKNNIHLKELFKDQELEFEFINIHQNPISINSDFSSANFDTNNLSFHTGNKEIIKLCYNGDIFIKGNLVENDKEVVDAMREFLKSQKFLS